MKILIAYYSRTGGTEKLAQAVQKELETQGHFVDVEKVIPAKEHSALGWLNLRMFRGECDILPINITDVSDYDTIIIGSPNWTRLSLPMAKYISLVKGLKYKTVSLFSTTAFLPALEWYLISAYLLDITFAKTVEKKEGRPKTSLMLSSIFKRWNIDSDYGKKLIKNFCDEMETPIGSIKSYFLEKKEIDSIRFLAVALSFILLLSFTLKLILPIFGIPVISWNQYSLLAFIIFGSFILLTPLKDRKKMIPLGKYLGAFCLVLVWTIMMIFLHPVLGRLIIWGYFVIFTLAGFFRDQKLIIFVGFITILGYISLFFSYSQKGILVPNLDLGLILFSLVVVNFVTMNLQKHFMSLLEAQEEIEKTKAALEIKITERTRELKDLTNSLDSQVREKTKKLQEKVEELERFNKLVIGRELKMLELKKEIEELKKELGK
ncbi:hypothetical protein L6250_02075 [Candidatus Parcubacteria bacterium]|nr:hypothetical protein [Patescibacteria group bacterium]MCG2688403.1 hypothetical protein [Candidatus Parcubacteria bacterium]